MARLPPHPQHQRETRRARKTHRRPVDRPDAHDAELRAPHVARALREALVLVRLTTERLDLAHALEIVHEQRVHRTGSLALFAITPMRRERVPDRASRQHRDRRHRHERERRIRVKQKCRHADHAEDGNHALFQPVNQHAFDGVHIFDYPREQIARSALVKVADGQALQFGVHRAAHVEDDALLKLVIDENPHPTERVAQKKCSEQPDHGRCKQIAP